MKSIIFLGDSVTDCSRKRSEKVQGTELALGQGWVARLAKIFTDHGDDIILYNRGFAGCITKELMNQDQWWPLQIDHADIVSVMIGINDIWHPFWRSQKHDINSSLNAFRHLINHLKDRADTLIVCEPMALPCGEVTKDWWPLLDELTLGQQQICEEYGIDFLPLQESILAATHGKYEEYLQDGVHPTQLGHRWIAKQWLSFVMEKGVLNF